MQKGRQFLSDLKLYSDYLKWNENKGRYETWEEACESVMQGHKTKYKQYSKKLNPYIKEAEVAYKERLILASQRNLQFRGDQITKHNARIYNCSVMYMDKPDNFAKGFYILLCGTGLGVSFLSPFVNKLPKLTPRNGGEVKNFVIEDSIEGWAKAADALISSYCNTKGPLPEFRRHKIRFDYSAIRPKGAFITGGFKAPGPDGLKQSLERIEALFEETTKNGITEWKSIVAYDIFMHLADAVLSGGVRRSAMSVIMSPEDTDLINAKLGDWRVNYPWRARSNNSVGLMRGKFSYNEFEKIIELNQGDNDIGFVFLNNQYEIFNPCVVGETRLLTNKGYIAIKKLSKIYESDTTIKIITEDTAGQLTASHLKWCGITKESDDIYEIKFSNNTTQRVNKTHKFYLSNHDQIEVTDLIEKLNTNETIAVKMFNGLTTVISIIDLKYKDTVYDLTAIPNYNFYAKYGIEDTFSDYQLKINNHSYFPFDIISTDRGNIFAKDVIKGDEIND